MHVLIVEDDASGARLLRQALTEAGYTTESVSDGETGLERARAGACDLVLLDVMLPGRLDGFAVCREMRSISLTMPILMLTARDMLEDKVSGLDNGADDYLVKPFRIAELLARMRALLRRSTITPRDEPVRLNVADLSLDFTSRQAVRGGLPIALSATEFRLLEHLMRNSGKTVTRSALLDHVWQYDFGGNDNVLDVYISYLRAKIDRGRNNPLIHTVRGIGYRFGGFTVDGYAVGRAAG